MASKAERVARAAAFLPFVVVTKTAVRGAGGRRRTVYVCNAGCWHNSAAQGRRCLEAGAILAARAEQS